MTKEGPETKKDKKKVPQRVRTSPIEGKSHRVGEGKGT